MALLTKVNSIRSFAWPWKAKGQFPKPTTDAETVRTNLLRLFSTEIGEDKTEPNFGLGLIQFVFATAGNVLEQLVRAEVIRAVSTWEPRAVITSLTTATEDDDRNGLVIVNVDVEWQFAGVKQDKIGFNRTGGVGALAA